MRFLVAALVLFLSSMGTTKLCKKCDEEKPVEAFAKCARDGLQSKCKKCSNAISIAWAKKNKEHHLQTLKQWRLNNLDAHRERDRAKRAANPEAARARHRRWREKNAEKERTRWHNYRAQKVGAGGSFTAAEAQELKDSYLNRCAYCFVRPAQCLDHVVPVSDGGENTIANLAPACFSCNVRKGSMSLLQFLLKERA